jgi:hypothetical protein
MLIHTSELRTAWVKPDLSSGQVRLRIPQADRKRNAHALAKEALIPIEIAQDDVGGVLGNG